MFRLSLLFVSSLLLGAQAANDWTVPCFNGECSHDLSPDSGASGTLYISGSSQAISDITPAAGWTIIGCNSTALEQDIRLVCNGDDQADGCAHVFSGAGPVGKLVRLPEDCGASAFVRIGAYDVADDQTIPANIAARIVRRDGFDPLVHAMSIDTNYSAIDPAQSGQVSLSILGSNIPGLNDNATVTDPTSVSARSFDSWIASALGSFDTWNIDKSTDLPAVNMTHDFPLFDGSVSCDGFSASLSADLTAHADALVTLGVAAKGLIVPPILTDFGVYTKLNANFDGKLSVTGSALGQVSSGEIPVFSVGIPGLDFPGILTLGPSFDINVEATGTFDVEVDMVVDLSYHIADATMYFPPGSGTNAGGYNPGDTPLQLSVSPGVHASGSVSAHLIPTLSLGLNALGGLASAQVFIDLDAYASLNLALDASTTVTVGTGSDGSNTTSSAASYTSSTASAIGGLGGYNSTSTISATETLTIPGTATITETLAPTDTTESSYPTTSAPSDATPTASEPMSTPSDTASSSDDSSSTASASDYAPTSTGDDYPVPTSSSNDDGSPTATTSCDTDAPTGSAYSTGNGDQTTQAAPSSTSSAPSSGSGGSSGTSSGSPYFTFKELVAFKAAHAGLNATASRRDVAVTGSKFYGCASMTAGLDVNVGASGSFFSIFNDKTSMSLFKQDWTLFHQCFGTSATTTTTRRALRKPARVGRGRGSTKISRMAKHARLSRNRRDDGDSLTCPSGGISGVSTFIDTLLSGSSIQSSS